MSGPSPVILAVGAAGKFAGLVVPELAKRGAHVRGLVSKAEQISVARDHGAVEVAVGDLRDRASLDAALLGIERVFYIAPAFLSDEAEVGLAMVEAAKAAGVRRFVFSSVIHPVLTELPNHAAKGPVEQAVLDSGMEYTFLHPALFFQNYAAGWQRVVQSGVLAEPWSDATRFSRVDYRDVAEVAAIALTTGTLLYGTFELCAEGALDRREAAALIAEVLGRDIRPQRIDPDAMGPEAQPRRPMFDHYDRHDLRGNALTLRTIPGREPRTLRAYFAELAAQHPG
jgi:uncharacterized protein YbjT (DUF2867 family)